jgi:hypothetical protein
MLPIDGAAVSREAASVWNGVSRTAPIHAVEHLGYVLSAKSGDRSSGGKEGWVVTPGGPRPRDQTHHVGPGETIRRNADGTYTVVPKDAPVDPDPDEEKNKKEK